MPLERHDQPSEESVREAMAAAWRDHHHARDQTWRALQMEAVLGAGLVTVDAQFQSRAATAFAGALVAAAGISGLLISWHHRRLERRKFVHITNCEEWLGLHRDDLIPKRLEGVATDPRPAFVRDGAVSVPGEFKWWHVFAPWISNTALFIMRMHLTIIAFAILMIVLRCCARTEPPPSGSPSPCFVGSSSMPEWLTGIGTILVAILAIWGDRIRTRILGPKIYLEVPNPPGTHVTLKSGEEVFYLYLRVRNRKVFSWAPNCQVLLQAVQTREPDGQYHDLPLPVPLQFMWCLSVPETYTMRRNYGVDVGFICKNELSQIKTTFYRTPNNFQGIVTPGSSVRYYIEIVADNYASHNPYVCEISWDGQWSDKPDEMCRHVNVRFV